MDLRALIFVPALTGSVIAGFVFALFAAHYYLTVLQSTASGARQVVWLSEPILDHFWKVFYLAWLIGLWLGPAWFCGRLLAPRSEAVWVQYAIPLAVFWLFYPVSQLSSLSGPSIWLPLHPGVAARLLQRPTVALGFLALSAGTLAGFGFAFHTVFKASSVVWVFIGSPLLVVTGLVYARLIGRLAFALMFTRSMFERRRKRKRTRDPVSKAEGKGRGGNADDGAFDEEAADGVFSQPSQLPPIETPDEGPLTGYDLKLDDARAKPRKRLLAELSEPDSDSQCHHNNGRRGKPAATKREALEGEGETAYDVKQSEVRPQGKMANEIVKPSAEEMRLLSRDDAPKRPKQVWGPDVLLFLVHPSTVTVILTLSAMCAAAGSMIWLARKFDPTADGP